MKILEFTGAPGIGKSTLCLQLEHTLRAQGYNVINFQRYLPGNTLSQKIYRKYIYKMIWHIKINQNIIRAFRKIKLPQDDKHKEWMERILLTNYQIHTRGSEYDYVLMDEGMIQFVTSLYHNEKMDNKKAIQTIFSGLCSEYLKNTEIIYLTLDLERVCERLIHRNRRGDRFILDNKQHMKESLLHKLENIDFTVDASKIPVYHLSCDNVPNEILIQKITNSTKSN